MKQKLLILFMTAALAATPAFPSRAAQVPPPSASPPKPPKSEPTPAEFESLLKSAKKRARELKEAQSAFSKLEKMEAAPATTSREAKARLAAWNDYLEKYSKTNHNLDRAKAFRDRNEALSQAQLDPAAKARLQEAKKWFAELETLEAEPVATREGARERWALWITYIRDYDSTRYRIETAEKYRDAYSRWSPSRPLPPNPSTVEPSPDEPRRNYTEDLGNDVGIEMVWVPGGAFRMGTRHYEMNEKPETTVTIKGFWIGKYEVTQEQFEALMRFNPSYFQGPTRPVERVSWDAAMEFCRRLGERAEKPYSLPTEGQWEYACLGESERGDLFALGKSEESLADHAWHEGNSGMKTHPVGTKNPNVYGIYDMYGNVWEWCLSLYSIYPYAELPVVNDPSKEGVRIIRGRSFGSLAGFFRSSLRYGHDPKDDTKFDLGFRVCRSATGP